MKLIKPLTTISLFFIFTFSSFADLTIDDYKSLLLRTATALTETTQLLEEAQAEIISLEKQISGNDSALKIEKLTNKLKEAEEALTDSNKVLEEAKERINEDQLEIKDLRNNLQTCIDNIPEVEMFSLGGGYVYPTGFQLLFMFDVPKIPISVYTNSNLLLSPFGLNFTIGVAYRF